MAHPSPRHTAQTPTDAQLKSALSRIAAELADHPLRGIANLFAPA